MADIRYTTAGVDFKGTFVSWDELEAARNEFRFANSVLVKVSFAYSRGDWYDNFIINKTKWDNFHAVLEGREGYYSDFAGKHSEACITFWDGVNLEVVTDQKEIAEFHKLNGWSDSNLDIVLSALEMLWEGGELSRKDGFYYEAGTIEGGDEE